MAVAGLAGRRGQRAYFLNRVPKYGNDNDDVDALGVRVMDHYCDVLSGYRNFRGGFFWPGVFSVGFHITMGAFTGATPDGGLPETSWATALRLRRETPCPVRRDHEFRRQTSGDPGHERRQSQHALSGEENPDGTPGGADPNLFSKRWNAGTVQYGGSEVLRDAQQHPEKHRDLFVRVSGYSAEFVGLSEIAQDEIISRNRI